MVYSNFDSRVTTAARIPEDRFQLLRELEKLVKRERALRREARLNRKTAKPA
ncbi:MAG: hypothetical protein KA250_05470 [Verrucomicrobiales bacterium]|jgi:hypothetical protein|nr:hypothetical protein [Verrucomicrobiales bacterium]HQZ27856.1 hypothetical protein [Verrucomicrobiales bacterium]